jgi:hypothetical protein
MKPLRSEVELQVVQDNAPDDADTRPPPCVLGLSGLASQGSRSL